MIENIRRRFIRIAVLVLSLTMLLLAAAIFAAAWADTRAELNATLEELLTVGNAGVGGRTGKGSRRQQRLQGTVDESRYFKAALSSDGTIRLNDVTRESARTETELKAIAADAFSSGKARGFSGTYLYSVEERQNGARAAVFLDCETKLTSVRRLGLISAVACAGGILLAWLLVSRLSSRAIRPIAENAARQKQFITDAGHELKTPLTVISANMDVLSLEAGSNQWIESTRKQIAGMRDLVNEMVYLSRMDEEDAVQQTADFDASKLFLETAEPFAAMAEYSGRSLDALSEEPIPFHGSETAIRRLFSVLFDNAVRYSPEGDRITASLRREKKMVRLTCENGLVKPLEDETLSHLFDRFFRGDPSRSKEKSGFGIGLSIARAVAERHGGTIRAEQTENGRIRFVCLLPLRRPGASDANGIGR